MKYYIILFLGVALFLTLNISCGFPNKSINIKSSDSPNAVDIGDDAFKNFNYLEALERYISAKMNLTRIIDFENKSPNPDKKHTQHLYNRLRFIEARIELTKICIKAREREQLQFPNLKPNKTIQRSNN